MAFQRWGLLYDNLNYPLNQALVITDAWFFCGENKLQTVW
ncbi:hypothetical protein FQV37_1102 [Psychrobacter nivimaris]|uniref:Uncharacterized protein n=1 Tax=Psychrobacter nivimaris TaxID=281738 RepID=A0A6N7BZ63_9GAMM|nr:hypothetical protein FQV37_1102 [Psychrobacter nivimaris]